MLSTFQLNRKIISREHIEREYALIPSAVAGQGYNQATGEVLDFTSVADPKKLGRRIPPAKPLPVNADITVLKVPLGFTADVNQAAANPALNNFVLRFGRLSTGAELATADYPAGLAGATVIIRVTTRRRNG